MPVKKRLKKIVKEDVKKVGIEVKKNWKKIIIVSAIIFFILAVILSIAGIKISFTIYDRLVLNLNPADSSFNIANDEKQNITFLVSIKDSIFCSAECGYEFYDRSDNQLVDKGSYTLKDKGSFSKMYEIVPYDKGSGQKIYNFDVECKDIDTFLCATHGLSRKKSSFITLNYELTSNERLIKENLKPIFAQSFSNINNASKKLQYAGSIFNKTDIIGSRYLIEDYNKALDKLNKTLLDIKNISDLWSHEDYITLDKLYSKNFLNKTFSMYQTSAKIVDSIVKQIEKQNILINQYNMIKDYFFEINDLYGYYYNGDKSKELYHHLDYIKTSFDEDKYNSIDGFDGDILNISYTAYSLNETFGQNYEHYNEEGSNITASEYAKKCDLGYCENLTNNYCLDLNRLFGEFANKTYDMNLNFSNKPYYLVNNNSVRILVSNESEKFYEKYCLNNHSFKNIENISEISIDYNISTIDIIQNELTENLPSCCVYGKCSACCISEKCKDDPKLYPVLLIHGHSLLKRDDPEPLLDMFSKIQYQMQGDNYLNAGTILFESSIYNYKEGDWGLSGFPVSAKASYYYDYSYSLGKYIYITRNVDNLDTYAIRLNDIIKLLKYRTGKSKVDIIAHSMGGLVARRYIQIFGEDSVNKLILIATPNNGISGSVKGFCDVFGEKRECEDMYDDSLFMGKLDDPNYKVQGVKIYTISGSGCNTDGSDGDGVVTLESSKIKETGSYVVDGVCDDAYARGLHNELLDIDKYPKVYDHIKDILAK